MPLLCDNDMKEELSCAYLHTVATRAGFGFDRPVKDRDSVDCVISAHGKVGPGSFYHSPSLHLQVKATAMDKPDGLSFPFPLKLKNYDDLRANRQIPILLVVYAMPPAKDDWVEHTEDGLTNRQCAYWCNLHNMPATSNTSSQTVSVPTGNILSPAVLWKIMWKLSMFEAIGHAI